MTGVLDELTPEGLQAVIEEQNRTIMRLAAESDWNRQRWSEAAEAYGVERERRQALEVKLRETAAQLASMAAALAQS